NDISKLQAERTHYLAQIAQILNLSKPPSIQNRWPHLPSPKTLRTAEARLMGQPLLRSAQAQSRAAQIGVQVAQRSYWPNVTVSAAYGQDFHPGSPNWLSVGVNLSLPIFPEDRQAQNVDSARAKALQAQYRYDDQHLVLIQRLRSTFARYTALKKEWTRTDERLLPKAQQAFSATLAAYTSGQAHMDAVLHTQNSVLRYALTRLQYRRDLALSVAEMDFLTTQGRASS
ncbi:TolC family protein, partial [Acidithiobacillus thiooxidans]|uniref:TolC family protein n=1 Tax=Acidithiobacillus thiooxidans TaxID=930 RepID=UPI00111E6F5F